MLPMENVKLTDEQCKYFASMLRAVGIVFFLYAGGINLLFRFLNFAETNPISSKFPGSNNLVIGVVALVLFWSAGFWVLKNTK
jgi:hypothetical protein